MHKHLIAICLVFLAACEGTVGLTDFDGTPIVGADATQPGGIGASVGGSGTRDGAALYQVNCASCHGAAGEGTPVWPTSIQGFTPIQDLVVNGRGTMPGLAIPVADVTLIQQFLMSLAAPAEALDGAGLYGRYCAGCHGATAEGGTNWAGSIQAYEPIESIVMQGRGTMEAVPVTVEQTAQIQAWLLTLAAPAAELDGEGLYARYCASCHGADASGAAQWPGSIQGYEPIKAIVTDGRGDMDPVALDSNQIAEVQAFLLTLAPPLSSLTGPQVYDRLCGGCHGERGAGTDTKGMQLRYDDNAFSRYWVRAGRGTQAYDSPMPAYPTDMISDAQLTEMFEWINDEPHPTDGEGLFNQYCANCHGADGRGGPSGEGILGGDSFTGVVREGKGGTSYGQRRSYMTRWSTQQLSDPEVQMLSAYAAGL